MRADYKHIVFLGIGGIGMSALARYYLHLGWQVFGYDKTATDLTQTLEREGAQITYGQDTSVFPDWDKEQILVVYTPALQPHDPWRVFFAHCRTLKRAEALAHIANSKRCYAIAGTHGKTSTSALLTHILIECGLAPSAFVGGLIAGYNTNFFLGESDLVVVEADEFDRSFLHLHPTAAAITTSDADHLDIYKDQSDLNGAFEQFVRQTSGPVFSATSVGGVQPVGLENSACWSSDERIELGRFSFQLHLGNEAHPVTLPMPGKHHVNNALLPAALAQHAGAAPKDIAKAITSFQGIARRFQVHMTAPVVLIEDYAHHPTELHALFNSLEAMYGEREVAVLFQPHLYSRTRDFFDGFVNELSRWKQLLMLPIYAAREEPIEGITSEALAAQLPCALVCEPALAVETIARWKPKVVAVVGAGDIGNLVEPLKAALQ